MNLIKKILDRLTGIPFRQEYLCLSEPLDHPPRLLLYVHGQFVKDVTNEHVFSGYSPLIFSFPDANGSSDSWPLSIQIKLVNDLSNSNVNNDQKAALATLELKKIGEQNSNGMTVRHYEGTRGQHYFLNAFQQKIMTVSNSWFSKKKDNVFLPADLLRQVQIAYALPRKIALVTVEKDGLYNLFPTDLHGTLGNGYYLDSLRKGGQALKQVEEAGKLLLSEVQPSWYLTAYQLGKNHMQPTRNKELLPFGDEYSTLFHLPVPLGATRIYELELIEEMSHGIHQLLIFRICTNLQVGSASSSLSHIHAVYATWRKKQGLSGNYLLR